MAKGERGLIERLVERLAPDDEFGRNVLGDLAEEWSTRSRGRSAWHRRLWYVRHGLPIVVRFAFGRMRGVPVAGGAGGGGLTSALSDGAAAWRSLRRSPGYLVLVVSILALALGASASMFEVTRSTLLRPLSWSAADRLVRLSTVRDGVPFFSGTFAYPDLEDIRRGVRELDEVVAYLPGEVTILGGGAPERVPTARVGAGFFDVLGVRPAVGRFFVAAEDEPGHAPVIVLSHGVWRSRFGGSPGIVGQTIRLDGEPFEVIGVAGADFEDPLGRPALWIARPPVMHAASENRFGYFVQGIGRIREGVTMAVAVRDVERVMVSLRDAYPEKRGVSVELTPLSDHLIGPARGPLLLLSGVVALLFLIACANIANLELSRAIGRRSQLAVRATLGAGRLRLARQVWLEILVPGVIAGIAAIACATAVLPLIAGLAESSLPRPVAAGLGWRTILAVAGGVLLASAVCGAGPVWQAWRSDAASAVRDSDRTTGGRSIARLRGAFVVSQIALSTVLLVGSLLLVRSFLGLSAVDPGVRSAYLLTFQLTPLEDRYPTDGQVTALWAAVEDRVRAIPGVDAAGGATQIPMGTGMSARFSYRREDRPPPAAGEFTTALARTATPGYFDAMGLRLLRGRFPDDRDVTGGRNVLVVSEALVREAFGGGEDPIGKRLILQETAQEIVGIVADVRTSGPWVEPLPMVWTHQAQEPATWMRESMIFVVRTSSDPVALAGPVRAIASDIDRTMAITNVRTMEDVLAASLAAPRFRAVLTAAFGLIAMGLAALGVGGVIGYGVIRRRNEIGIRAALGANRRRIVAGVLGSGIGLAGAGAAIGLIVAAGLGRLIAGFLYGVGPIDPATFAIVPASLIAIACLASLIPALHAARIDPLDALRRD